MTQPTDLDALIDAASREATRAGHAPRVEPPPSRGTGRPLWPRLMLLALLVGVGWAIYLHFAPVPKSQVQRDLEAAVEQARLSVEAAREPGGKLPQALPNAALARIVDYQPQDSGYRLEASILGVRVTLERDGSRHVEKD